MNVVCFYNKLYPQAAEALNKFAPECVYEDTSATPSSYWQALRKYLTGDEDVIVIEQDIEITEEVIPSFSACKEIWCAYGYKRMRLPFTPVEDVVILTESLGCTKFSVEAQRLLPADFLKSDIGWAFIDIQIAANLKREMFNRCGISFTRRDHSGLMTSHVHGEVKHHH